MSKTLFWLQCGGCGGDTFSLLNADSPGFPELLDFLDIELLWHPSLSTHTPKEQRLLLEALVSGEQKLDVLCIEGAILRGPGGTGMFDTLHGKPKKDLAAALCKRAQVVIAVGTCASFGGICATDVEGTGLQFHKTEKGGLLGKDFLSSAGLPVINLAGCPAHCEALVQVLPMPLSGISVPLDDFNRPLQFYGPLVHQGCTRNEYHEYRIEERDFGEKGCLFFYLGCRGPLTHGACNKILWNGHSSKTRAGLPCFGCTSADFPQRFPFFRTRNIEGIPIDVPEGVKRSHYMVYKEMAAVAAPERLKKRKTEI